MSDGYTALAETVHRVDALIDEARLNRDEVLDIADLSDRTGEPESVVKTLLKGHPCRGEEYDARVIRRLLYLRETRRRPFRGASHFSREGTQVSWEQIAQAGQITRQGLSASVANSKAPNGRSLLGIEDFFQVRNGYLTATAPKALRIALELVIPSLESTVKIKEMENRLGATVALRMPTEQVKNLTPKQIDLLTAIATDMIDRNTQP
ncbi:hypothetical protein U9R90_27070 [Streptomyces sp. E11-3]|uniref:hypothetical protein n=1 Tax=Streptomyces sp. E11-3 TaxID=3110112 RepID=UPI00397EF7F3